MSNFSALNASHGIGRHVISFTNSQYVTLSLHTLGQERQRKAPRNALFALTIRLHANFIQEEPRQTPFIPRGGSE